ncbi:MAG: sugar transferase [Burkholderiaceae bacterium]|uniref:sugar transferase n=1 Tax=Hydrogenophaga sp. TaxID=1904254 RepID=UPI0027584C94|nr:sugar transferase [Hydrogenophaga sp.]MDP2066119.1 sugar transferase [Burkholderiaceae bacterium]MDZ4143308.1 sugar transferase [Burkholderiales bacterium]MDZ4398696.1 sugar transferase [Hydrogenophaga sp.]
MKRLVDVGASVLLLVLLGPLLLGAATCIALESGFPVLFRQTRLGLHGREFGMFKFRSMVKNAAAIGPYFTADHDPRITRVGRFIRRTSIDELPQLLNVLAGDMSLVGPRPDVPAQRGLYADADWAQRCSVRPGITGLAQALLRSEGSEAQRLEMDLCYSREASVWLDLKIMWWTLGRLSGKGAN